MRSKERNELTENSPASSSRSTFRTNPPLFSSQENSLVPKKDALPAAEIRRLRIQVMKETLQVCRDLYYFDTLGRKSELGDILEISRDVCNNRMYYGYENMPNFPSKCATKTVVCEGDCIEVALSLKNTANSRDSGRHPLNPIILNMACAHHAGGGFLSGSGAQEENIFRRSNYCMHLINENDEYEKNRKWKYPLPEFGVVYSPNVLIFRHSENRNYEFMQKPESVSFIAAAAYNNPPVVEVVTLTKDQRKVRKSQLTPEFADKMKMKIRMIVRSC
eukprot:Sdes_comp9307_c0_seq1m794